MLSGMLAGHGTDLDEMKILWDKYRKEGYTASYPDGMGHKNLYGPGGEMIGTFSVNELTEAMVFSNEIDKWKKNNKL